MEQENKQMNSLPDNAYRELAPGEEYKPMMPANTKPKDVTPYSVTFGIIMAVIFSAAAAYLGLKSRTGIRGRDSYRYYCCWCGQYVGEEKYVGTKRDYPVYRS